MAKTLKQYETTTGKKLRKREDAIGRDYWQEDKNDGNGWEKLNPEKVDIPRKAGGYARNSPDPKDEGFVNPVENTSDDYGGDNLSHTLQWSIDEGEIPVENYPLADRIQQATSTVDDVQNEFEECYIMYRFRIVFKDGHVEDRPRMTKVTPVEDLTGLGIQMENKYESIKDEIGQSGDEGFMLSTTLNTMKFNN